MGDPTEAGRIWDGGYGGRGEVDPAARDRRPAGRGRRPSVREMAQRVGRRCPGGAGRRPGRLGEATQQVGEAPRQVGEVTRQVGGGDPAVPGRLPEALGRLPEALRSDCAMWHPTGMTIEQIVAAIRALPLPERLRVIEIVAHETANDVPAAITAPPSHEGVSLTERHGLLVIDAAAAVPAEVFDHRQDREARADYIWGSKS